MAGTLYVVATPIGNLEDLTFRALRILKEVDAIAAEDTRRTRGLLTHFGISKPLLSVREHNERRESSRLVARLRAGESIALVSDAGTPGISDPGATLVAAARDAGVAVVPIPGPSALTAALSVSGIQLDSFVFLGFPPPGGHERAQWMQAAADDHRAVVFFEAPHRIDRTIAELAVVCGTRHIVVFREITKKFEDLAIRPINELSSEGAIRPEGEFAAILMPVEASDDSDRADATGALAIELFDHIAKNERFREDVALKAASAGSGFPAHRMRNLIKRARFSHASQAEDPQE